MNFEPVALLGYFYYRIIKSATAPHKANAGFTPPRLLTHQTLEDPRSQLNLTVGPFVARRLNQHQLGG